MQKQLNTINILGIISPLKKKAHQLQKQVIIINILGIISCFGKIAPKRQKQVILINILVDIIYGLLDPRIRLK